MELGLTLQWADTCCSL